MMAGAGSAAAWQWAPSHAPLTVSSDNLHRGGGYGSILYVNYSEARLTSVLSDARTDGMRTYARGWGLNGDYIGAESGRRSDGGSVYTRMLDKPIYSAYPKGVGQYDYRAEVCMDKSFSLDPCSVIAGPARL